MFRRALKLLRLRKVYTIVLVFDQTIGFWRGPEDNDWVFKGKRAWRTTSKSEADATLSRLCKDLPEDTPERHLPWVCAATWEFRLNREDWTWNA